MKRVKELIQTFKNIGTVTFTLSFYSNTSKIYEEVLIFDDISLLGSLGGSLGLFVGFSFFGYVSTFNDIIMDKVMKWMPIEM